MNAETIIALVIAAPVALGVVVMAIDHIRSHIELTNIRRRRAYEAYLARCNANLAEIDAGIEEIQAWLAKN